MAKKKQEKTKETKRVQPVVAVVGHIDHGKTSLLDYIRKAKVASGEAGGITQRISAYEIEHESQEHGGRNISFIDTPGHEAFQEMRRRGASAADIAILVIAADDGVKPQTTEAWNAIKDAGIPYIVALTKIDKDSANLDRAKDSILKEGIYLEGLGGDVPWVGVSSKTGEGIPELLDLIILVCDLEEIHCNPSADARAVVIESTRDPKAGTSATVVVRSGVFANGGFTVADDAWAPLRIIEDATGKKVPEVVCGQPARITGFSKEPRVGSELVIVASKKEAEKCAAVGEQPVEKVSYEETDKKQVRIILKADTAGSLEALEFELQKVPQENAELVVVQKGVGAISENDVKQLVGFTDALIAGFNVSIDASARDMAERQGVATETKSIIYELTEWLTEKVAHIAPPKKEIVVLGRVKVLKHFSTTGTKHVIGGRVEEGVFKKGALVSIHRRGIDVGTGKVINVQSQKADVEQVTEGTEFGAQIETKADVVGGDILELRSE